MRAFVAKGTANHAIAELATRQYGLVTRGQLISLGIERGAIANRLATARLHRVHQGVYAVGHRAQGEEGRWLAAVLACGHGGLLSHQSAAVLWRISDREGAPPHVTVPSAGGRRRPGIVIHRAQIAAPDARVHLGIPVTSPARTLVDLAGAVDRDALIRVVREAQFRRRFDLEALNEVLARRPCRTLQAIVQDLALTQSGLEDRLLSICDRYAITRPSTQQWVLGRRLDFVWRRQRVVVETDGWEGHGTRSAFQADRAISNALQIEGYIILRFTHADLTRRPSRVARQIRVALAASPSGDG